MDIHPKGIHAGDQYGTTIHPSKPAIDFPKKQSIPGFGKQIKPVKPHGGDQFGTTIEKSKPFKQWPNADVKMRSGKVELSGSAMRVDSEKIIESDYRSGMNIKGNQTGGLHSASGTQQNVRYAKKGQMGNSTPQVF